jgi:hypothetical protein
MSTRSSEPHKYELLRAYLAAQPQQQFVVRLPFKEIESILGEPLPDSAYDSTVGWWTRDVENTPRAQAWTSAGFGIGAVAHQSRTSGWVDFVRGVDKWPGLAVDSKAFGQQPVDTRLRELALGYVQSAKLLSTFLGENADELCWPRASVACFCYRHAVELFLKSCILHRRSAIEKCSHDISGLRKEYLRLYPEPEFYFETPYDISLDDLDELFGVQVALVEDFERKQDQVFRYLSDKQGRSPRGLYVFGPGGWVSLCERLESDINRVWAKIREVGGAGEAGAKADGGRDSSSL